MKKPNGDSINYKKKGNSQAITKDFEMFLEETFTVKNEKVEKKVELMEGNWEILKEKTRFIRHY